tara:strand:- start:49312 stop:49485 length:174 start_codon:yes stop_codon:yes gene_type:complete
MKTRVKQFLEIPARKQQKGSLAKEVHAEKYFLLMINLWIFRYEYRSEIMPTDVQKEK